jgi:hypothetical protein
MKKEIIYKGVLITRAFPSGFFQYYSEKHNRFMTYDFLESCKQGIDSELKEK